jgi:hypothetical protein
MPDTKWMRRKAVRCWIRDRAVELGEEGHHLLALIDLWDRTLKRKRHGKRATIYLDLAGGQGDQDRRV